MLSLVVCLSVKVTSFIAPNYILHSLHLISVYSTLKTSSCVLFCLKYVPENVEGLMEVNGLLICLVVTK